MRRPLVLLLVFPLLGAADLPVTATDLPTINVVSGIQATLNPDGTLGLAIPGPVLLQDGRKIEKGLGRWEMVPATVAEIKNLAAIDLSVNGLAFVGQRIRVSGGYIVGAEVRYGQLVLPGSHVNVMFDDMARDHVKRLVENCSSFMRGTRACDVTLVATVQRERYDNKPVLVEVILEAFPAPPMRAR